MKKELILPYTSNSLYVGLRMVPLYSVQGFVFFLPVVNMDIRFE